jgi:hypothetical protein
MFQLYNLSLHGLQSLALRMLVFKFSILIPQAMNLVVWFVLWHLLAQSKSKLLDLHILTEDLIIKRLDFLILHRNYIFELLIFFVYLDWLWLIFEFKTALLKFFYLDYQLLIIKLKSRILFEEIFYQDFLLPV